MTRIISSSHRVCLPESPCAGTPAASVQGSWRPWLLAIAALIEAGPPEALRAYKQQSSKTAESQSTKHVLEAHASD